MGSRESEVGFLLKVNPIDKASHPRDTLQGETGKALPGGVQSGLLLWVFYSTL